MSKRLKDNLTSRYFGAANKLNSKRARHKIVVYVESYDDIFFWRTVLAPFENDRYYFQVTLPTRSTHLERGKKAVLMSFMEGKMGEDMVACVDADYDYLVQGATNTSKLICYNPYVFHTYAYAIESLQCYAPSLHDVSVAVSLNDQDVFDMEAFLKEYSQIIFPLFVWNIYYYRSPSYSDFTITDFLRVIDMGKLNIYRAQETLNRLRHKVGRKIESLRNLNPNAKEGYLKVKEDIKRLGVTPDTTYLYIQGHHLFDKVVVPMLDSVCQRLVELREQEIKRQSLHNTQYRNELSCYSNSLSDIATMLKKNTGAIYSEPFKRIQADVEAFMNKKMGVKTEQRGDLNDLAE